MKLSRAKKVAADRGLELWWDKHLKLWSIFEVDPKPEAYHETVFIASGPLASITEELFIERYLNQFLPNADQR